MSGAVLLAVVLLIGCEADGWAGSRSRPNAGPLAVGLALSAPRSESRGGEASLPRTADASRLQELITQAAPGSEIRVTGGAFFGPLTVDKPLRLVGVGRPVIDGRNTGTIVRLSAPGIHFSGFVVRRSGDSLLTDDTAILVTADDVTVEGVEVQEALHGIYVLRGNRFRLLRNQVRGKSWIYDENRGDGIHLHAANDGGIESNDFAVVRDGVYFNYSSRILIKGNRASRLRYGLHYMWSHDNHFVRNEFTESVGGAALMYSRGIVFDGNLFARQRGFRAHGVLFKDVERCRAVGNRFLDNTEGITLDGALNNRFEDNLVAGNDAGVVEYGNSEGNVFTGNAFLGNGTDLRQVGQRSSSRWDDDGRGNYWSSYDGFDLDGDGVGDSPHRLQNLFEFLEGERPMLRLLAHGPCAAAIRLAERSFPVLRQHETLDRHPLMRVPAAVVRADGAADDDAGPGALGAVAGAVLLGGVALVVLGRRR